MILISRRGRLLAAEFPKHHMGFLKKIFDTPDRELFAFGNLSYAIAATFHTDNVHLLFGNATSQIMEQLALALRRVAFPNAPEKKVSGVGEPAAVQAAAPAVDTVTEIKKYKALLEEGVITEEEFAAKKKQLMGL